MRRHFLSASFSEKKNLLILVYIVILAILLWLLFFQSEEKINQQDQSQFDRINEQLSVLTKAEKDTFFYFNPNTITEAQLKQLKVNPVALENWLKKRDKYAFRKPDDVLWVKGLSKHKYLQLQKYMVFEEKETPAFKQKTTYNYTSEVKQQKSTIKYTEPKPFDLNTITQNELEAMKIRSYIAERLVKFRESLGGFYAKIQLQDIYGIKEFELKILSSGYIKQNEIVSKNWSQQSFKELLSHPYVDYELCKRIFFLKDSLKANQFSELEGFLQAEDYQKLKAYYK